ncbi:MAG TPA: histidine kinase [Microscillaceae bacterium]|nr:histidine kinase [Microscillaceae bacterium]
MSTSLVLIASFTYLALLFLIAWWGEKRAKSGKSLVNNPYVYALSFTVFCTAWTYYGSVGRAATSGVDFLTTYIGPTLVAPLWWLVLRKIIQICKVQRITTIADLISSRYGKNVSLGGIVTIMSLFGIIPYIALQLKAIATSFNIITEGVSSNTLGNTSFFLQDTAFYVTIVLVVFTILFGTRTIIATDRHEGMVSVIAFESIIKLLAFLLIGVFVTFGLFDGLSDIFSKAAQNPELSKLFIMDDRGGNIKWLYMCLLSMLAIMFLPRQFQVAVVENARPWHLNRAMWMFPLYLLLINLFVIPIAFGGKLFFGDQPVDADTFVLSLPLSSNQTGLTLFAFIGGFSAATSMIIVSSMALSFMFSNNLLMPLLLLNNRFKNRYQHQLGNILIYGRRLSIFFILLFAYIYNKTISSQYSLVSTGLTSFVAIAQFAPAILGGIYWKQGHKNGALVGILAGFVLWFFLLIVPALIEVGLIDASVQQQGLWGASWLRPQQFLGLTNLDPISHALFWSMFFNILCYVGISYLSRASVEEHTQAEIFVNIHKYSNLEESGMIWTGIAYTADLTKTVVNFLGEERAQQALEEFSQKFGHQWKKKPQADTQLVTYLERLLASTIGAAAARLMIASVASDEEISNQEVLQLVRESQELKLLNEQLKKQSEELETTGEQLKEANQQLIKTDHLKNEFISTVTHEMRTPLTSIRAFSEILADNPDLEEDEKVHFLETIIKETNRMERLINQVLDLERFASGQQRLNLQTLDINKILQEAIDSVQQVIQENNINLKVNFASDLALISGDADRLMQVVLNLLSNAIKFSKSNAGEITVTSFQEVAFVRVEVIDNGKGIKKELHQLIFEKFYQDEDQNIRKPKGSGLGLAISKTIIDYHQGSIWVDSEPEKPTKFCFRLPIIST